MDIIKDWSKVREHFNRSIGSNLHVAIASVDAEHHPTVTPIGSFFLNSNQSGFYFEKYATKLPLHAKINKNICILGVNSSYSFWFKSLFKGQFSYYPAIKLYAELGVKRKATEKEISRFKKRTRFTKSLKGHEYLWGDMTLVREVKIVRAEPIRLNRMTSHLTELTA